MARHGLRELISQLAAERRYGFDLERAVYLTVLHRLFASGRTGQKSLIGNKGYRRFLKIEGGGHFLIDEKQIALEEGYDGLFVLRTDTDHDAETIARVYKMLWMVEDSFRTAKSIRETRPRIPSYPPRVLESL